MQRNQSQGQQDDKIYFMIITSILKILGDIKALTFYQPSFFMIFYLAHFTHNVIGIICGINPTLKHLYIYKKFSYILFVVLAIVVSILIIIIVLIILLLGGSQIPKQEQQQVDIYQIFNLGKTSTDILSFMAVLTFGIGLCLNVFAIDYANYTMANYRIYLRLQKNAGNHPPSPNDEGISSTSRVIIPINNSRNINSSVNTNNNNNASSNQPNTWEGNL